MHGGRVLPLVSRINQYDISNTAQALGRVEAGEGRADDDYARHRRICACLGQPPGAGRVAAAVGPRFRWVNEFTGALQLCGALVAYYDSTRVEQPQLAAVRH